jgi:hypothetical protein
MRKTTYSKSLPLFNLYEINFICQQPFASGYRVNYI